MRTRRGWGEVSAMARDAGAQQYHQELLEFHEDHAEHLARGSLLGGYYHHRMRTVYRQLVPAGARVLELGCGLGDLLADVRPSEGVGVDLSPGILARGRDRHPQLRFIHGDAHSVEMDETFDIIILSDLVIDLWDIQLVFRNLKRFCRPHTRIIMNTYSRLWQLPMEGARRLGLARPRFGKNWVTVDDLENLLYLENLETVRAWTEILWPIRTPLIDSLCNRFLVKMWPFRILGLSNFLVARPGPEDPPVEKPIVSVIVPARNEAGNIREILRRTPEIGGGTELVFVEGNSTDDTYRAIEEAIPDFPERICQLHRQTGKGKGDAVRLGFSKATGNLFMILDADMTVPPEDLPLFYEVWRSGRGEFVNGVRLVYPMGDQAMRFVNLLGNKFFSLAFSWLLGQPVKDTLCGTKVLSRDHYGQIAANRSYFGDFDPFGDFDLLFGAARLNLKIVDVPIRYRNRTYGTTNISRWRHGALLLRMTAVAARRLKFI